MTLMSSKPEPTVWSREIGQRIPCFNRCQLIIAWMLNIKDIGCKTSMAAMLCKVVVVVVGHTAHAPAIYASSHVTMKRELHVHVPIVMVLRLVPFRPQELRYYKVFERFGDC